VATTITIFAGNYSSQAAQAAQDAADLGAAMLPAAIGVGIVKYRLYDIDRIFSRTLAYAIVTGLLVGVYLGLVLLASLVRPSSSPVVVAGSTLVVAALFHPLRRRVQRVMDRRFNRARYNADQIVTAHSRAGCRTPWTWAPSATSSRTRCTRRWSRPTCRSGSRSRPLSGSSFAPAPTLAGRLTRLPQRVRPAPGPGVKGLESGRERGAQVSEAVSAGLVAGQQARDGELLQPLVEDAGGHPVAPAPQRPSAERPVAQLPQDAQRPPAAEQIHRRHQRPAGGRAPDRDARTR
jgi:hypothetical protein